MPVIKQNQAAPLLKSAIVLDMGDVSRQAHQIVESARQKAQRIVNEAQQRTQQQAVVEHDKAMEAGRAEGIAEGFRDGSAEGRAKALADATEQFQQIQDVWLDVAQQWQQQRDWLETEGPQAVLDLALRMAERIVYRVIEVDPSVIVDQVAAALAHVLRPSDVTVHIRSDDREVLELSLPLLMAEFANLRSIRIKDDPQISRGGCELRFGQGAVDATIDTQLRRIVELILPANDTSRASPPSEPEPDSDEQPHESPEDS